MSTSRNSPAAQLLFAAFQHSATMNAWIAKRIPARYWTAKLDNQNMRTIAAIFAHMLQVQKITARTLNATSGRTNPSKVLPQQRMVRSLAASATILTKHISRVLAAPEKHDSAAIRRVIKKMLYLLAHDAHHRGQIFFLAHYFGFTVSHKETMRLWRW